MFEKLPEELKEDGRFCLWRYERRKGRLDKVPYRPDGRRADATDIKHYVDFSLAADAFISSKGKYSGIGLGVFKPFGCIDGDACYFDSTPSPLVQDVMDTMDTYTESSPSGTGVRMVFRAAHFQFDAKRYYINNRKIKLEAYAPGATGRFCTITGNCIRERGCEERSTQFEAVLEKYMVRPMPEKKEDAAPPPGSFLSDRSVIRMASASAQGKKFQSLWNGAIPEGKSHSEADMALAAILAFWCGGDAGQMDRLFRQSGLMRDKWDRVQSGSTYGQITLEKAVSLASDFYTPRKRATAEADFDTLAPRLAEMHPDCNARYTWNDSGSGRLFADIYKGVARYVPERKMWFAYDGVRWVPDIGGLRTMELAKSLGDSLVRYALTIQDEQKRKSYLEYSTRWQARSLRCTFINDAQSVYPISMAEFDKNIYYINCKNVTVDARTGIPHEHTAEDLITKTAGASYDPDAKSPRFLQFVDEVTGGDREKARFIQKTKGYGLTGDTSLECLFIEYGATTRNGKGTMNESCLNVAGDYGLSVRPETIATKHTANSQAPSEDIARLAGVRYASIAEPRRGLVVNEALVKSMTGNDTLNARFLHENSFDFHPQFKIYMNTNYLPVITDMTLFTSGRIILIPYGRHFEEWEQDKGLKREFASEEARSAILNWMLEGYAMLLAEGLNPPRCVTEATKAYEHDSDKIKLFSEECLEACGGAEVKTSAVYQQYRIWCGQNGCFPENSRNFNQALRTFGEIARKRPKDGGEKTTLLLGYRLLFGDFIP